MTPDQLVAYQFAQQQTQAAWISAGAAVAQAFGALLPCRSFPMSPSRYIRLDRQERYAEDRLAHPSPSIRRRALWLVYAAHNAAATASVDGVSRISTFQE